MRTAQDTPVLIGCLCAAVDIDGDYTADQVTRPLSVQMALASKRWAELYVHPVHQKEKARTNAALAELHVKHRKCWCCSCYVLRCKGNDGQRVPTRCLIILSDVLVKWCCKSAEIKGG